MSYTQLRRDLLEKLGRTPQRLSQQVQDIKRVLPMSTQEATCLLAHLRGLDISRYLDQEQLSRVRQLVSAFPTPTPARPAPAATRTRTSRATSAIHVTIAGDIKLSDPIVPKRVLDEAKLMAERVYPITYVFENSVRHVIQRVMTRTYGDGWWETAAPDAVRANAEKRIAAEKRVAWHGRRGSHSIHYTDINDLKRIVSSNWAAFAPVFGKEHWFSALIDQIERSRNVVAHHNPIGAHDIKRLEVNLIDWQAQISACVKDGLL